MSDQMKLSQAEIDALLSGGSPAPTPPPIEQSPMLTESERDMLGEIGNISFGSAATSLSGLLQQRVEITTPQVSLIDSDNPPGDITRPYVFVSVEFTEGLKGSNALAIEVKDAKTIADLMLGGDGTNIEMELNELHLSAVGEAMNQMMGGAATSMSTIFQKRIDISPPKVRMIDFSDEGAKMDFSGWIVSVSFRLRVGSLIDSTIMQLVPLDFAKSIIANFNQEEEAAATAAPVAPPVVTAVQSPPMQPVPKMETTTATMPMSAPVQMPSQPVVQRAEFTDFGNPNAAMQAPRNLSLLFDVPLNVTVELGRTKKSIRDILDLAPGSILELDKLAGEPVDILVNNKRIAIGEVVVIDENFGVRVTDIVSPIDRVKNLQ